MYACHPYSAFYIFQHLYHHPPRYACLLYRRKNVILFMYFTDTGTRVTRILVLFIRIITILGRVRVPTIIFIFFYFYVRVPPFCLFYFFSIRVHIIMAGCTDAKSPIVTPIKKGYQFFFQFTGGPKKKPRLCVAKWQHVRHKKLARVMLFFGTRVFVFGTRIFCWHA
jgi:hypothetical protein